MYDLMISRCKERLLEARKAADSCRVGSEAHRVMMLVVFAFEDTYAALLPLAEPDCDRTSVIPDVSSRRWKKITE